MKKIITLIVFVVMAAVALPQTVTNTINFTADMSQIIGSGQGFFDPDTDSILVMGLDWDDLGTVTGGNRKLTRVGMTSNFTTSITVQSGAGLTVGDSTKWKFKAFPDSKFENGGWESSDDRWVVYQPDGSTINLPPIQPNITPLPPPGDTYTITFIADISGIIGIGAGGAFDPSQDSLLVMGLDWEGGTNVQGTRRMAENPLVFGQFVTTLTVDQTGDSTKWKFKAFPDARFANNGWEFGEDRWINYSNIPNTVTIGPIVPRIQPLYDDLTTDVNITLTVDMNGAVNRYNNQPIPVNELNFVGLRGGADFFGNWFTGGNWQPSDTTTGHMKVLTDIGGGFWKITVTAPIGTPGGTYEYKYAAMYPGADTVNGGSSPLDNEGGFGVNHLALIVNGPDIELNDKFGVFTTSVEKIDDAIPASFDLSQNYPNPFNPSTKIKYTVPEASFITLKVYNVLGQEVAILINKEQTAGSYELTFNPYGLSSGIYFYTLTSGNVSITKKMMYMK